MNGLEAKKKIKRIILVIARYEAFRELVYEIGNDSIDAYLNSKKDITSVEKEIIEDYKNVKTLMINYVIDKMNKEK